MNIGNALSLIDPIQIVGLIVVGILFGFLVLHAVTPDRALFVAYLIASTGMAYFVFLIVLRYVSPDVPQPIAERTIGTALEWLVFSGGCYVGLIVPRRAT